jgi:hypothetical protein
VDHSLAGRFNTNISLDTHWAGRLSLGVAAYSQNPEWGFFAQALLLRDGQVGGLPGLAIGARNIGRFKREDRFLIGHDIVLNENGEYDDIEVERYRGFETAPTLYAVATKEFALSPITERGRTSMSLSVGYGNGLFSEDGDLGDFYNARGTIVEGLFLGSRFVTHPSLNTTLTFLAENDGWDWNAGAVADWRGISLGVYATELEEGGRDALGDGFNVYNSVKFNIALGYAGNIRDIARGVVLRTRITQLTREQHRLRVEIASRERRIRVLEVALREAQEGELAQIEARRRELEAQVEAERDAIRRATERLRELEQGRPATPQRPPQTPPGDRQ